MSSSSAHLTSRLTKETHLECDILIAGGGAAGWPCALAAARAGAKVILCQDRPVLGGNASSEIRMHIVGADGLGKGTALAMEAREGGIIEEVRLEANVTNPQRCYPQFDLLLYDKCREEKNLQLLLNTSVIGAETSGNRIKRVRAERPTTEDSFIITASTYIDCTGDGRLGAEAGAEFRRGRESQAEFGEDMAQPQADPYSLGSTLLFTAKKHDRPMPFRSPNWARKFTAEDLHLRLVPDFDRTEPTFEYGYWWLEWGGQLDTIKDNELIRDELLAILMGVWDHIKNSGLYPRSENWAFDWFGFVPGKRESRRFLGLHVLDQRDVMESPHHADAIAFGGWPIDTHPYRGIDEIEEEPCRQVDVPHLFDIPLRSCVSKNLRNLLFAGRNISATHIAFASTRVMATCAAVGQGVGTAAAIALQEKIDLHDAPSNRSLMRRIQQRLLRDDAYLIGQVNEDPLDLARTAIVTASSETPAGPAVNILTGQTRSVHGPSGAPPGRYVEGSNRWISQPIADTPEWIQLNWSDPVEIHEVRIVFDTGMHQRLTLSASNRFTEIMQWGSPRPETAKDFTLLASDASTYFPIAQATGNYQRLRVFPLDSGVKTRSLRLAISATNGIPEARVMEIRVY